MAKRWCEACGTDDCKIDHSARIKFQDMELSFDKEMVCVPSKAKYSEVDLCLRNGMNIQVAEINGRSVSFDDRIKLGHEIEKRWNFHSAMEGIARQVISNDIGLSAAAIVDRYINGKNSKHTSYPSDGSDFGRCYHLIQETGIDIKIMKGVSDQWDSIVFNWEELVEVYRKGQPLLDIIRRIVG